MCTVSVIGSSCVLRVVVNRDELRTRPIALPPQVILRGERQVLMPIDPASGGTWLAANDEGLILVMLNRNVAAAASAPAAKVSRGTIIPAIAGAADIVAAAGAIEAIDLTAVASFRLLIIGRVTLLEMLWDLQRLSLRRHRLGPPIMFTSSGLGDDLVDKPRRRLFEQVLDEQGPTNTMQDAFHRHHWPDRGHLSVCMSRSDAQTVSRTVVRRTRGAAVMCYTSIADAPRDCGASSSTKLSLAHSLPCHSH